MRNCTQAELQIAGYFVVSSETKFYTYFYFVGNKKKTLDPHDGKLKLKK